MKKGSLEVICGCMYSGKTEELIRRIRREQIAGRKIQSFKSHRDIRYSQNTIQSHIGTQLDAIMLTRSSAVELQALIDYSADAIAIDEIQFFDIEVAQLCDDLANSGKRVIVAGLDLDFRGEPFRGPIQSLLCKADRIDKLTAVCVECGQPAVRTQRLVDGRPAKWTEPILSIGGKDIYQAVCRLHHRIEMPPKEERNKSYEVI